MADTFRPPGHLDVENGNISHNFIKWKRQWKFTLPVLTASGNAEKDEKIQVNILLHCAGPKVINLHGQMQNIN